MSGRSCVSACYRLPLSRPPCACPAFQACNTPRQSATFPPAAHKCSSGCGGMPPVVPVGTHSPGAGSNSSRRFPSPAQDVRGASSAAQGPCMSSRTTGRSAGAGNWRKAQQRGARALSSAAPAHLSASRPRVRFNVSYSRVIALAVMVGFFLLAVACLTRWVRQDSGPLCKESLWLSQCEVGELIALFQQWCGMYVDFHAVVCHRIVGLVQLQ